LKSYVLEVHDWETPASKYPLKRLGSAEIWRGRYKRGLYLMEGVAGYVFFHVTKPINVTALRIHGKTVMVDDPLHWIGMKLLAEHCSGRTLIGGLGLGLIVHALNDNNRVESIDVYEINGDVIELVKPLLPVDERVRVIHGDVFTANPKNYDTIVLDLWVGRGSPEMMIEMLNAYMYFKSRNINAEIYIWGLGDEKINPAVNMEARKIFLKVISGIGM